MTYTVSHRQGGVQRSAVGGLIRHEFRDIDKHNGVETQHSNERIIPERTELNESWMWVDGQEVELTDSRQIVDELDRRLEGAGGTRTNKKTGEVTRIAVRQDAKVVRDVVLQLDPKFTRSSEWLTEEDAEERQAETRRLLGEMIDHYGELYGRHNLLAASLHLDETSPHVHLMVTPIDDEGRVRQESFVKGKQAMRENDRAMRQRLAGAGYDVDPEPRGGNRSNMGIDEYAQWQQRIEQIEAREVEVEDREARVNKRSSIQNRNKQWLSAQKEAHDAREARLSAREAEVGQKAAEAEKVRQKSAQRLSAANELRERAAAQGRAAQAAKKSYQDGKARVLELEASVKVLIGEWKDGSRKMDKAAAPKINAAQKEKNRLTRSFADFEVSTEKSQADDWQPDV